MKNTFCPRPLPFWCLIRDTVTMFMALVGLCDFWACALAASKQARFFPYWRINSQLAAIQTSSNSIKLIKQSLLLAPSVQGMQSFYFCSLPVLFRSLRGRCQKPWSPAKENALWHQLVFMWNSWNWFADWCRFPHAQTMANTRQTTALFYHPPANSMGYSRARAL
jgi:hypothetical protein